MTLSDQARLLLRKAAQDLAVLALAGCDYPRSHNIGLLLDLLNSNGLALPSNADALAALTPFGTVFRYDDLPFEDIPDRHSWPPLLHSLLAEVQGLIDAGGSAEQESRS